MRRRIYWLLPDLASARRTTDDLLLARIPERHIHFVAREDADMTGLHQANVLQTSDVIRAAEMGLVVGGSAGSLIGVAAAIFFPIIGDSPQWGIAAVLGMLGAGFGAWSASMIGVSVPSTRLKRFSSALDEGQILMMVDVPSARVKEVEARLQALHPEARPEGIERNVFVFP